MTKKISDAARRSLDDVHDFMQGHFPGSRRMWEMDGPPNTAVAQMVCYSWHSADGSMGGILIFQVWNIGGWIVLSEPVAIADVQETAEAIVLGRHAREMRALLLENQEAWEGEEESVKDEHADLINRNKELLDAIDNRTARSATAGAARSPDGAGADKGDG